MVIPNWLKRSQCVPDAIRDISRLESLASRRSDQPHDYARFCKSIQRKLLSEFVGHVSLRDLKDPEFGIARWIVEWKDGGT